MSTEVLSVSALTAAIKGLLEPRFARVAVRGEVSNFRGPNPRGHLFFTLKDAGATLPVVIWATTAQAQRVALRDGLALVLDGALSVYEPHGSYRLVARRVTLDGAGALALAFERLKAKLAAEGLLGPLRTQPRRPLPLVPRRVGVVTSVSGAALRDFLHVVARRHPGLAVLVCDARVQGDGAAVELARGVRWLEQTDVDVIVLTRGGGSAEDLWAFNDERLARTIFGATKPVVSAVGHEIDTSLADLVADVRAATPSAAAELVAPDRAELLEALAVHRVRLGRATERRLLLGRRALSLLRGRLGDPRLALSRERFRLDDLSERLARALRLRLAAERERLASWLVRLERRRPSERLRERRQGLGRLEGRLGVAMRARLRREHDRLGSDRQRLERASPRLRLAVGRARLAAAAERLGAGARRHAAALRQRMLGEARRLHALSPLAVLERGYAVLQRADGRVVRRALEVRPGERLDVRLGAGDRLVVLAAGAVSQPGGLDDAPATP